MRGSLRNDPRRAIALKLADGVCTDAFTTPESIALTPEIILLTWQRKDRVELTYRGLDMLMDGRNR